MATKDDHHLGLDLFMGQRERIISDTCFSSSNWQGSGFGSNELAPVCDLSFPIEEPASEHLSGSLQQEAVDCTMKDTHQAENNENDGLSDSSLDLIGHLKPVSVVAADEESLSTVQLQEEEETGHEVTVSREGKRKRRVSQAASMIKHHVRRRKKTED